MLRSRAPASLALSRNLRLRGLDEARVWDEVEVTLGLRRALRSNVEAIAHYALTEMLNNAIEHSEADRCSIRCSLEPGAFAFEVRDPGIGVFDSIASKLHFEDEQGIDRAGKGRRRAGSHTGEESSLPRASPTDSCGVAPDQVEWNQAKDDVFVRSAATSAPGFPSVQAQRRWTKGLRQYAPRSTTSGSRRRRSS
jgi:hypothetical protein